MLKIVDGNEFDVSKYTVSATKLSEGDNLCAVKPITKRDKMIVLHTHDNYMLKFRLGEIPSMRKNSVGVRGIKLNLNDYVENIYLISNNDKRTLTCNDKEVRLADLKTAGRDTKGTKTT